MAPGVVVCIGFMGAGKTTAARSVAEALGTDAVDVDREIERQLGKPIAQIFSEDGEASFREAEERITLELLNTPAPRVLSLGGGAIGSPAVREALAAHMVLWIDVDPEVAWERCAGTGRPLAQDRPSFERLYREREPVYAALADATVPAQRSDANAEGSVPSGGTRPLETTSTPARGGIRSPCAARTVGRQRAGTARQTRSSPPSASSEARITRTVSGSSTPGR